MTRRSCSQSGCKAFVNTRVQGEDSWYCLRHETLKYGSYLSREVGTESGVSLGLGEYGKRRSRRGNQ